MGFLSDLRGALSKGEDAFRKLCRESNALTKEFEDGLVLTSDSIGGMKTIDFTRDMRAGEVKESFIKAKPEMVKVATDSNAYIISLEREARDLPEYHLREATAKQTKLPDTLKGVSSAEELEKLAKTDSSLDNAFKKVERKAGSTKKYVFLGVAIVGAVSVYEAVEAYAKSKTGCLLYTSDKTGKISVCKVLQASCLNPQESSSITTCSTDDMGPDLTKVSCSDWDSSVSACNHCSADTFDYSLLRNNQFLKCQEKADFLDAVGDLFYGMGVDISDGIASLKGIVKWILIGVVVVVVIAIFIWIFKKFNKHQEYPPLYPYPPTAPYPAPTYPSTYPAPSTYPPTATYPSTYPTNVPGYYYKPVDETLLKYHLLKLQNGMAVPQARVDPYRAI